MSNYLKSISSKEKEIDTSFDVEELEKEPTLTPSGKIKQKLRAPLKKDLFQTKGELFSQPKAGGMLHQFPESLKKKGVKNRRCKRNYIY